MNFTEKNYSGKDGASITYILVWSFWTTIYLYFQNLRYFVELSKKSSNSHRGVVGIESAIVLIAFVIVAAALAFVVLNMGFATTQKAKTSITSTLAEAGSSMEVSGTVVGYSNGGTNLTAGAIPVRVTSGGGSIDLDESSTKISYSSGSIYYDDVFEIGCNLSNGPGAPYA